MTRRRALRLALIGVAATIVIVLVVGAALVGALIHRPLPDRGGTVSLSDLDGTVAVMRDALGVPHVYADTTDDLFRAQGYVQAQDRFFEMDLRRHITAGRLSELVGANPDALRADEVIRTMGWREVAARELPLLSPTTRSYLEAYARGVNDYLSSRSASELSVSYTILGLDHPLRQIEPWTPLDSLTWLKAMAWDLRTNYTQELDRARIVASVKDPARVGQLYPAYPYAAHSPIIPSGAMFGAAAPNPASHPVSHPAARTAEQRAAHPAAQSAQRASAAARPSAGAFAAADVQAAFASAARALDAVPAMLGGSGSGVGSNSWAVSGALTVSGKPLLANDPHQFTSIPGIWYQMGLHCRRVSPSCPFDVAGYTFSGLPGVVIGHNARIAWGLTNLGPDVTDFYLEKVDGDRVLRDGKEVALTARQEVIRVAGAPSVRITVRSSVHGPLLSDVVDGVRDVGRAAPVVRGAPVRGPGYAVALAWTALTPGRTIEAIFGIDVARDFAEFRAGALRLEVPAQNLVYADVDGHIGYQAPGKIPIRSTARSSWPVPTDGTWPLPGWDSAFDWKGYVPTSRLPWVLDPPDGFIVTANQPVTGPGSPVYFTSDWDYGFRSQRIRDLLTKARNSGHPLGIADMRAVQADTRNGMAAQLVPPLLTVKVDAFTRQAQDLLRHWDFRQPDDSAPAAYFNAVWATLLRLTFDDELPEGSRPDGGDRWFQVVRTLLAHPHDAWWDDRTTADVVETRDEVIRQALVQARLELTSRLGKEPSEWEWGRLHRLTLVQQPLGASGVPALVHLLVNRGPYDLQGGSAIVDAFAWDAASGSFDVTAGPSMRMIVDLSNLDRSRWVNETGNSGHPADAHYADQVRAWLSVHDYPWAFSEPAVRAATRETLTLAPAGG